MAQICRPKLELSFRISGIIDLIIISTVRALHVLVFMVILKTSAVSRTEFQSTIFELSQRILSNGKKYSYQLEGTMGSNRKNQKLFSFALYWLHILQHKSVSWTEQRKTFNFRKMYCVRHINQSQWPGA